VPDPTADRLGDAPDGRRRPLPAGGRELPTGGDQGHPDVRLGPAVTAGVATPAARAELLAALVQARVFAAVTATATGREVAPASGLSAESSAELAVLLVQAPDGSRALPVFSGLAELAAWRPDVRPVVLTGAQACQAAVDEGASAVLLDPAGPAIELTQDEMSSLADGRVPVPGSSLSTRRTSVALTGLTGPPPPELVRVLRVALADEGLAAARLLQGPDGLVLGVAGDRPLPGGQLAALAARVVRAAGPALPVAGIDLAEVAVTGPGLDLLAGRDDGPCAADRARPGRPGWFTRRGR